MSLPSGSSPGSVAGPRARGEDDVLGLDVGQHLSTRADHGDAPLPSAAAPFP